jgi:hypothetical protein
MRSGRGRKYAVLDLKLTCFHSSLPIAKDSVDDGNGAGGLENGPEDDEEEEDEEEDEEDEDEGMEGYWSFIFGMLTNLGALPVAR